ncbi:hypothetical protein BpHYR1_051848 [Brachionus plicatilis]|uniref:Uncharacterized protein n=1 Tax=Brachionus plicatilis TaxID=10195 RepID=A0A3M7SIL1_BRAPC|nr:hypothetical protein BpHYR1_051848 [Brachionus plicatilis]
MNIQNKFVNILNILMIFGIIQNWNSSSSHSIGKKAFVYVEAMQGYCIYKRNETNGQKLG